MTVDSRKLEDFLADRLRLVSLELRPLKVKCAWPVFKGLSHGVPPMFVKVVPRETAARALAFLSSVRDCDFLPRPVVRELFAYEGHSVLCLEWKDAERVDAEKMTDAQLEGFLAGCRRLAEVLSAYAGDVLPPSDEDAPEVQFAALERYAERHRLVGRLLKPLLGIPESARAYGERVLVIIHGDLQPKNYGFDGDRLAAVYDTDDLTLGLACEDAAYAFTERARRSELTEAERRRLCDLFRRFVAASPWPKDEWKIAVSHARLRIAARRLKSHPDSVFVAFDIARRDKPLRMLAAVLEEVAC